MDTNQDINNSVNSESNSVNPVPATPPINSPKEKADRSAKSIKREGRVIEALPNAFFKVVLDDGPASAQGSGEAKKEVMGFLSGKMRLNRIKILTGDKVTLEMSPYDDTKGRIVYRLK